MSVFRNRKGKRDGGVTPPPPYRIPTPPTTEAVLISKAVDAYTRYVDACDELATHCGTKPVRMINDIANRIIEKAHREDGSDAT